jgi:hypothetical protein
MRSSTYSSTAARRPCSEPKCHVTGAGERPAAAAIDRVEVAAKPCSANSSEAASRSRARPVGSLFATTRMVACVAVPDSDGPGTVSVANLGTVQRGDAQCNRTDPVGAFGDEDEGGEQDEGGVVDDAPAGDLQAGMDGVAETRPCILNERYRFEECRLPRSCVTRFRTRSGGPCARPGFKRCWG